jgi:hypothetical protein
MNFLLRFRGLCRPAVTLALALCLGGAVAHAQRLTGELTLEKGIAKVRHGTTETVFKNPGDRALVEQGDVVQTGPDTRAKISFRQEGELVDLFPNSHFRVDTLAPKQSILRLSIGKAVFLVRTVLFPDAFQVKTPTVTIGVKGTEFILGTDGAKSFLSTISGTVTMTHVDFPDKPVQVGKDQATVAQAHAPPPPAITVTPAQQESLKKDESLGSFQQVETALPPPPPSSGSQQQQQQPAPAAPPPPQSKTEAVQEVISAVQDVKDTVEDATTPPAAPTSGPVKLKINR